MNAAPQFPPLNFDPDPVLSAIDDMPLCDGLFGVETDGSVANHVARFTNLYLDASAYVSAMIGGRVSFGTPLPRIIVEPYEGVPGFVANSPEPNHVFLGFIEIISRTFTTTLPATPSMPVIVRRTPILQLVGLPADDSASR